MSYYLCRTVDAAFDVGVQSVTAALKEEGFGVLSDIDVQATLKDKLGVLLSCNVIVRDAGGGRTEVAAIDPVVSMDRTGNPELASLAEEVCVRLRRAVETA